MGDQRFERLVRCPASHTGSECRCSVFYDWGLELLEATGYPSIEGGEQERYRDYAGRLHVKICVRCETPYVLEGGKLIDISEEVGQEEVTALIARWRGVTVPESKARN